MRKLHRIGLTLIVGLLTFPAATFAQSWSCEHNNLIREVEVVSTTSEPAPCEVVYTKATEGFEAQVLWSAQNDAVYCANKATGLVEKLQGWGWECSSSDAAAAPMAKAKAMATTVVEETTEAVEEVADKVTDEVEEVADEATDEVED